MALFGSLKMGFRLLPYVALIGLFGTMFLTNQKNIDAMKSVTKRLDTVIEETQGLNDRLEAMKRGQDALSAVVEVSNERASQQAAISKNQTRLLKEIANAKPEEDGPVAPVLDRTLTSIDSLRDEAKTGKGGGNSKADPAS
jgi:hypothetical protein